MRIWRKQPVSQVEQPRKRITFQRGTPRKRQGARPAEPRTLDNRLTIAEFWQLAEAITVLNLAAFRSLIRPGDLVFDIGGNIGTKTLAFRMLGARVIFVEPLLSCGPEFIPEFFWKWGNDPEVVPVGKAVSADETVTIQINRFLPAFSSTSVPWMTQSSHSPKHDQPYYRPTALLERTVGGIKLDQLIETYGLPAFVKVDVEGAENAVFRTLTRPLPAFNMEFHRDWIPKEAIKRMDGLGHYEWNYCLNNQGSFVMDGWTSSDRLFLHLDRHLSFDGDLSWGDIYGRLVG